MCAILILPYIQMSKMRFVPMDQSGIVREPLTSHARDVMVGAAQDYRCERPKHLVSRASGVSEYLWVLYVNSDVDIAHNGSHRLIDLAFANIAKFTFAHYSPLPLFTKIAHLRLQIL
jgi:hypothetical protein